MESFENQSAFEALFGDDAYREREATLGSSLDEPALTAERVCSERYLHLLRKLKAEEESREELARTVSRLSIEVRAGVIMVYIYAINTINW